MEPQCLCVGDAGCFSVITKRIQNTIAPKTEFKFLCSSFARAEQLTNVFSNRCQRENHTTVVTEILRYNVDSTKRSLFGSRSA